MEGQLRREVFLQGAYQVKLVDTFHFDQLSMANNEVGIKNILLVFETLELHVDHVFDLITLEMTQNVRAVFETGKQVFSKIR